MPQTELDKSSVIPHTEVKATAHPAMATPDLASTQKTGRSPRDGGTKGIAPALQVKAATVHTRGNKHHSKVKPNKSCYAGG